MKEYLWLYEGKEIPVLQQSIIMALEKNDIRAACLCRQGESRGLIIEELLLDERLVENGILLDKELLCEVGGKNTRLQAKWEYELTLRVAGKTEIMQLPFAVFGEVAPFENYVNAQTDTGEEKTAGMTQNTWEDFCVDAYIVGRYCEFLKKCNQFEAALEAVLAEGLAVKKVDEVQQFLEDMITHAEQYYYYYDATQPILVYRGDACCYNILNIFAGRLAEALQKQGNCIEFYDTALEDVQGLPRLLGKRYKASVGFQAWILSVQRKDEKKYFQDMIGGPKYNFIFDHPIWMQEQLRHVPERYYVLTHDRNYQSFIKKYDSGVKDVYILPPGGRNAESGEDGEKRTYDVAFLGTYGDYRKKLAVIADCVPQVKFLAARFLLYMKKNPDITAEMAFQRTLDYYKIRLNQEEFLDLFGELKAVIQCVMYYYREKTVEQILKAGIELHVFGDSWRESPFAQNSFLKLHGAVYGEDAIDALRKSKISLNIMAWHKDGFTERIADSMLAGAVVVSDYSTQLEELFGAETVLFDLRQLGKLSEFLKELLADEGRRRSIAEAAKKKASTTVTWEARAKELLQIIEEESRNR